MNGTYVGYVARHDRLYGFLQWILNDRLRIGEQSPAFRVFRLAGSNEVYAYEEKFSGGRVICKFYGTRFGWDVDRASAAREREYRNLKTLRRYGLVGSPHHVIRPLGYDREINNVLALEYYEGEQFSQAISRATHGHDSTHLFWRLKALAYFLATQHNRTAAPDTVDFEADCQYFGSIVDALRQQRRIRTAEVEELLWLRGCWHARARMWSDRQVWLHGDATPANFLFGHRLDVGAIDLERMKRGDRLFDVGRVAGELQHAFMSATGNRDRAEPFIGHFVWEYSCHFPDRHSAFASITSRLPFYMGLNLLRIARNGYIGHDYGRRLISQAKDLLRAP